MKKHSKQLEKRIADQLRGIDDTPSAKRRSSKCCKNGGIAKNESSPELSRPSCRRSRQYFLEPIRRWNSFHNSRERKPAATTSTTAASSLSSTTATTTSTTTGGSLPYLQTLVNLQRESRSACARLAQSVLPKIQRGAESAPVLTELQHRKSAGTVSTTEAAAASAAGSPTKKQHSSPNLLLVYDRRHASSNPAGSPRRSTRRSKTPPHQQQQQAAVAGDEPPSVSGQPSSTAAGSVKVPFAIIVGDTTVAKDAVVPRIRAIRADSMTEKTSPSYLAVDVSPQRRYSFWSVVD